MASLNELRYSHALVDTDCLPRVSIGRFHETRPLLWVEGFDLLEREATWVPFELVHSNFTLPLPPGSGCFPMTSNGLASGNHVLEAVSHALCEVVERDAVALWHAAGTITRGRGGSDWKRSTIPVPADAGPPRRGGSRRRGVGCHERRRDRDLRVPRHRPRAPRVPTGVRHERDRVSPVPRDSVAARRHRSGARTAHLHLGIPATIAIARCTPPPATRTSRHAFA